MSRIVLLAGDGIGPEVTAAARAVLEAAAGRHGLTLEFETHDFGGCAIDAHGDPFPAATRAACLPADAVFLGAVGGPKWDGGGPRPEAGLLALREALGAFANLRPITLFEGLEALSPLRPERVSGTDMLIVRELTGGIYFGEKQEGDEIASDLCTYSRAEVERIARIAFEAARGRKGRVTSVDKANVLATSRLWRKTVIALRDAEYPDVELDHVLVDAMAMKLIDRPSAFDVVVTENMFGDILSDEASEITGSIGLAPSASLSESHGGLFEPIHGSAPDIAGQGKANPVGAILSAAMLLRHALDEADAAETIEQAVSACLADGIATGDIGGTASCEDVTRGVCDRIVG
ncbi:3-isopropylmalate dehydrogenase [Alteriqipengyuania lutimaris]|uniref:3-isopropylmalate dehydrogenase n=1 Tax=Alteriqipengyuania lutimaris TaxID=1538146 RepID=A0A395LHC5_9SPHN|nr:3-isopropylmalate dehydrogenase [Alteriqipengyuania lutimaris]MBB3034907.1 3-isopropylmalate dehydrogenase [Alteriqipengyuania lutimaris]RDS76263.1 3-isopropylmalate dehydrogenase [Alteriqipengyuania lutimaris]